MTQRIAALSLTLHRIGLAISDPLQMIAQPLKDLPHPSKTALAVEKVSAAFADFTLEKIVVGLPLLLSGERDHLTDEAEHFIQSYIESSSIPVIWWDARLTTAQATRSLRHMQASSPREEITKISATLILQNYLDFLKNKEEEAELSTFWSSK